MRVGPVRHQSGRGPISFGSGGSADWAEAAGSVTGAAAVAGAGRAKRRVSRKKKPGELVLAAGEKPQLREQSSASWTKAKQREFLTVLSETCNVTRAAAEAGVCLSYAYKKRSSDAGFRAGWAEAIATAYRRLELVLLERAFNGTEKIITRRDGSEDRVREYSNATALTLLKMHRDTVVEAETDFAPQELDELRQRLIGKLDRLKARNEARDGGDCHE